jgi:hypothetical protein
MGVFIFFDCCDKNLIVLSRQLLIPLNSSKDDNSFVIIFLFLKFEIFVLFLLPTVKKIVYILLERMLIFPSVLCSPRASPSGYKLHLRKNHAFLSLNIQGGPDITCQKNSGSSEGSNKSEKSLFIRSKIMGIN